MNKKLFISILVAFVAAGLLCVEAYSSEKPNNLGNVSVDSVVIPGGRAPEEFERDLKDAQGAIEIRNDIENTKAVGNLQGEPLNQDNVNVTDGDDLLGRVIGDDVTIEKDPETGELIITAKGDLIIVADDKDPIVVDELRIISYDGNATTDLNQPGSSVMMQSSLNSSMNASITVEGESQIIQLNPAVANQPSDNQEQKGYLSEPLIAEINAWGLESEEE